MTPLVSRAPVSSDTFHLHNRVPISRRRVKNLWRQERWWICIRCSDQLPDDEYADAPFLQEFLMTDKHTSHCERCKNLAPVFIRARSRGGAVKMLCEPCIVHERQDSGRMTKGRTHANRGGEPLNQPPTHSLYGRPRPCEWCGQPASPTYVWEGRKHTFCGWAHAGLWMDQQMGVEPFDEAEAESYVRRSLGMNNE